MRLALVDDELFLQHESPPGHPERPERLQAARRGVEASLWRTPADPASRQRSPSFASAVLPARDATVEELGRVHSADYLDTLSTIRGRAGYLDADTFYSERSFDAAVRAAGGALALTDALLDGQADFGFGLLRPPGHHACPDRAMGFCMLNNVAIAARHAQQRGVRRVFILDWDVHHGNGTQDVFYDDPSVLYVSLHQSPQYPGSGGCEEVGQAEGLGFTINVPLAAGASDALYLDAFMRLIIPAAKQFAPEFTLISAGYDAHRNDPLGGMNLSSSAYGAMSSLLKELETTKLAFVLEGGYDLRAIEESVRATLDALVEPPNIDVTSDLPDAQVSRAIEVQRSYWAL